MSSVYREKVARLEAALDTDDTRAGAADILRVLFDRIVLTPSADGLAVELHGDLFAVLALCEEARCGGKRTSKLPGTGVPGSLPSVVAGVGFEPTTFRL